MNKKKYGTSGTWFGGKALLSSKLKYKLFSAASSKKGDFLYINGVQVTAKQFMDEIILYALAGMPKISNVHQYNRALSNEEIENLYKYNDTKSTSSNSSLATSYTFSEPNQ